MAKFIITVRGTDELNPDFAPNEVLAEGREAEGFALITFDKDGDPDVCAISHVTTMQLAHAICKTSLLKQAAVIAEGIDKAAEIATEEEKKNKMRGLAELLRSMDKG